MDWPGVIANASIVALLLVVGWRAMRARTDDQRRMPPIPFDDPRQAQRLLLRAAGLAMVVATIAIVWTLIQPS
jgi:multisubunit Na+/H+ antiporter MnhB subunit